MIAAALVLAALPCAALPTDWPGVWRRAQDLLELEPDAPARAELLSALADEVAAAEPGPQRDLATSLLDSARGQEPHWSPPPADQPWPFDPEASWLGARIASEGSARARCVEEALRPLAEQEPGAQVLSGGRLQLAWSTWLAAALDLRFDDALAIGRLVHRDQAADWSALSLALTATRAGLYDEADAILAEQIERGGDRAALATQRGIVALAAGDEARAREALGRAILWGSTDAIGVVARSDLAAGRRQAARAGFRTALLRPEPGPWARRGWGLSLLPARRAGPPWAPAGGPDPASW